MSVLNISDAGALCTVLRACQGTMRVRWVDEHGNLGAGTARALVISPGSPMFLARDDEVRDAFVWITTEMGWEVFQPVREVMAKHLAGEWMIDEGSSR